MVNHDYLSLVGGVTARGRLTNPSQRPIQVPNADRQRVFRGVLCGYVHRERVGSVLAVLPLCPEKTPDDTSAVG
ncbi:hypothetical protein GCM10009826_06700 [Humibacillus xanthopallidus]